MLQSGHGSSSIKTPLTASLLFTTQHISKWLLANEYCWHRQNGCSKDNVHERHVTQQCAKRVIDPPLSLLFSGSFQTHGNHLSNVMNSLYCGKLLSKNTSFATTIDISTEQAHVQMHYFFYIFGNKMNRLVSLRNMYYYNWIRCVRLGNPVLT